MKRGRIPVEALRRWRAPAVLVCVAALLMPLAGSGQGVGSTGRLVFATGGDGVSRRLELAVMRPDRGGFRKLTHHEPWALAPSWTSGGAIAFETYDPFTDRQGRWLMSANGTKIRRLPAQDYDKVSPNGRLIARLTDQGTLDILTASGRRIRRIPLRLQRDDVSLEPLWSPDGRWIAVGVDTETESEAYSFVLVASVAGGGAVRRITPRRNGRNSSPNSWSPDGRWVVVDVWTDVRRRVFEAISPDGTRRHGLFSAGRYGGAHAWAPDSKRLAFVGPSGNLFVASLGGRARKLVATRWRGKAASAISVSWSSKDLIAYTDRGGVYLVRVSGRGKRLLSARSADGVPSWSPDGTRLLFASDGAVLVARPNGAVRTLTQAVWDDSCRWSPDGTRIAFVRGPAGLRDPDRIAVYVMQADGKRLRRLGSGYGPVWSPDGRRVAFVRPLADPDERAMGRLGAGRIVVAEAGGSSARVVGTGTAPAWLPEGRELSFMRYAFRTVNKGERDEQTVVTSSTMSIVGADGAKLREVLTTVANAPEPIHYRPAWSPDGSVVAFASETRGDADPDRTSWSISLFQIATGETRTLAKFHAGALAWSPDGGRVAVTVGRSLGVLTVADGSHRRVASAPEEARDPVWSPDGSRIGFIACMAPEGRPPNCDVHVVDAADGRARKLTKTPGFEGSLDWR